jgi:hypothetical protein
MLGLHLLLGYGGCYKGRKLRVVSAFFVIFEGEIRMNKAKKVFS